MHFWGQDFFVICLKQIFPGTTKFGGRKKILGALLSNALHGCGPGLACGIAEFWKPCITFRKSVKGSKFSYFLLEALLRLPDVLERQGSSLNFLLKPFVSLILEKHLVVLEYFPASLKILE